MFDEVTASSLVKVDLEGKIVMETPHMINPAGFTIHSAVHAAREDAMCVMHLHTDYGIAVSAQKKWPAANFATVDVRSLFSRLSRLRRPRVERSREAATGPGSG